MMKKSTLLLLIWYAALIVLIVVAAIVPLLDYSLLDVNLWVSREQLALTVVLLIALLTFFLVTLVQTIQLLSTQSLRHQIKMILQNKNLNSYESDDQLMVELSEKVRSLTRQVQLIDNQDLVKREEIIESERKRIARDLHDTVSQELFASSMVLSGLAVSLDSISKENLQQQLATVKEMIEGAQRDLRILLLHLRPSELDGKSLVEGFQLILNEVTDKSRIEVIFKHDVQKLPTLVEEHLFRIAQEIISNTLRHAQAQHLEVYLLQNEYELQLKMVDDGVGFVMDEEREMRYGLQNIRERVEDMAGSLKIRTAENKGVAIDIRIPLLKGQENDQDTSDAS